VLVLRRLEQAARGSKDMSQSGGRAFIDLLGRIIRIPDVPSAGRAPHPAADEEPRRLIVP
jgi:hypothetical protein